MVPLCKENALFCEMLRKGAALLLSWSTVLILGNDAADACSIMRRSPGGAIRKSGSLLHAMEVTPAHGRVLLNGWSAHMLVSVCIAANLKPYVMLHMCPRLFVHADTLQENSLKCSYSPCVHHTHTRTNHTDKKGRRFLFSRSTPSSLGMTVFFYWCDNG